MTTDPRVPPRVLLATDGSAAARLATRVAARIAAGQDAELIPVHVTAPTEHRVGRMAPATPLMRRLDDPLASSVLAHARALAFEEGATCVPVLLSGDPADAILAWVRGAQPELVVLGGRARPAFARGGTVRRVQARAACPVLAVTTPVQGRPALRLARPLLRAVARYAARPRHEVACPCCAAGGCGCCGTPPIAAGTRA
jgi:nucleotide-binding universal stress UspA family protein